MQTVECEENETTIETGDGERLAASVFEPSGAAHRAVVVNSAMAMPRRFYAEFARWLAGRDCRVVTYDYRGIGDSRSGPLQDCEVTIADWAHRDMPAVIEWTRETTGADELYLIGHSMGGQIVGLLGDRFGVDATGLVTAQTGYWRRQAPGQGWQFLVFASAFLPALTKLLGYFPWGTLMGGEDIPEGAAMQWSGWIRNPNYLLDDESLEGRDGFGRFSSPVVSYSFDDDPWGGREAVDWLADQFTNAPVERVHLAPEDVGVDEIGHFGFFRSELSLLWEGFFERLRSSVGAL